MLGVNDPQDILGIGIRNLLEYRDNGGALEPLLANWNRTVIIEIMGIYAVSVHFHGTETRIEPGEAPKFHLRFALSLTTMTAIAKGEISVLKAFLIGQIKIKKIWHLGTLVKFLKIIIPALKIAGERGKHFSETHRG